MTDEKVQPCWICGKVWTRNEAKEWFYYKGLLVCRTHPGAKQWYSGAINLEEGKYKLDQELARIQKERQDEAARQA